MLKQVFTFINGMSACFDENGKQIPELQGATPGQRERILKASNEGTRYYYAKLGTWCDEITLAAWLKIPLYRNTE